MEDFIFEKLKQKGIENSIDIFEITRNKGNVTISYFDGEMDIERHKLKEKELIVDLWTNLDDVIEQIKRKIFIPTKENYEEPNKSYLLKELLDNPRVDSISINIEKVGEVEQTHITAKMKTEKVILHGAHGCY